MLFSRFVFDLLDRAMYLNCNITTIKGITKEKDIIYNNDYPEDCTSDLYYKKGIEGKYPVLLNIHGGGFVAGDKKFRLGFGRDLANQGLFVMNINYGLCPKYKFPDFVMHSASALQWLKENSLKYNLDLDNVFVSGDSAGAYIASYLGVLQSNKYVRDKLEVDSLALKIKGLILYCGPYQVESLLTKKILLNLQAEIGGAFLNIPKSEINDLEMLSNHPLRDILNITPLVNSDFPPSFLTYARCDFLCPDQGEPFIKKLEEHSVKHRYHYATKSRDVHCYHLFWHSSSGRAAMRMTKEFIKDMIEDNI